MSSGHTGLAMSASIEDLQWSRLVAAIARRCLGEAAVRLISELTPAETPNEARRRLALVAEALSTLAEGEPLPVVGTDDLEELLARIERGGDVAAVELVQVARLLGGARALRSFLRGASERLPLLARECAGEARHDREFEQIERAILGAIEPHGYVKDEASAELRRARHAVATARKGLGDKLRQLSLDLADVLRDGGPVERDGRVGLPVRADAHRRVEGIVIGASATGATLYVEPPEVTAVSNRLRIAEGDVEREERRIVCELTALVRSQVEPIAAAYAALVKADGLSAIANWSRDVEAVVVPLSDEPAAELVLVRHPLLLEQGVPVVPNDIRVRAGEVLVVSGPNAGGKTVALKTLGLAALMIRAGLPIVADRRSRLGWFAPVVTDMGDHQSLERSLSTFSAHVVGYRTILEAAGHASEQGQHALVLLDEVAGSTDPEEGAALGVALLEALLQRGAAVVATTHYERLKQRAYEDARFANAAVGFDFDRMVPTFTLRLGVVGASAALAAAERHGLPAAVVCRARELMPKAVVQREELIADLERERDRERHARLEAEADKVAVRRLRGELEEERANIRTKERKRLQDEAAELRDAIRGARSRLLVLERTQGAGAVGQREAERIVDEAAKVVALGSAVEAATREVKAAGPSVESSQLTVGMKLVSPRLGVVHVLELPERGRVRVRAGAFNLLVPLAELRIAPKGPHLPKQPEPRPLPPARVPAAGADKLVRTASLTCDLRGMRADAALSELDRFIDRCLRDAEPHGFALHGHGTGALRQAVREHLALHANVTRARPADMEEGGDAFTAFWMD